MSNTHWTFLSSHAHVLVCLARNPEATLREVADKVGITERSAQRLIGNLDDARIMRREKNGRRNYYVIDTGAQLRHPQEKHRTVGDLLETFLSPARLERLEKDLENYNARMSDRQ